MTDRNVQSEASAYPTHDDDDDFRMQCRAWLDEHCPTSIRGTPAAVLDGRSDRPVEGDATTWLTRMADRGWTAPTWPSEFGGGGLTKPQAAVLRAEMARLDCPIPLVSLQGLHMMGPALMAFGTDQQKQWHLPRIARGEVLWCEGFSEPGAGSDLASVSTRAVRDGQDYVVTGQKVWTSHADKSDWIFVLVRTDPGAPAHDGLSVLLIDMASAGVSVRPIELISGESEFCEVFFDEVRAPCENMLAAPGDGWKIAKFILAEERNMFASGPVGAGRRIPHRSLVEVARQYLGCVEGPLSNAGLRNQIADQEIDRLCIRAALRRARSGASLHPSVLKLVLSETTRRQHDLVARVLGQRGLGWAGDCFDADELDATRQYLYGRSWTIGGGTSEIQLNIIAQRLLGLPTSSAAASS